MRLVRVLPPVLLALTGSCTPAPVEETALRVTIEIPAGVRSTCVKLELRDVGMRPLQLSKGALLENRSRITAGVPRGTLPETLVIQAIGFSGPECAQRTMPEEVSEAKEVTFPSEKLRDVTLTLAPAAMSIDADGDLVPLPADCDDTDPAVAPGKAEVCTDSKDNDCNQAVDCADMACAGQQCRGAGSSCLTGRCTEAVCDDGLDNDGTEGADCADSDCAGRACLNGGMCTAGACMGAMSERGLCADGVDNDGNDGADCLDPDCNGEQCSDGQGCTTGERCSNAFCDGGVAVTCAAGTNVCAASMGVCQEPDGGCLYAPLPGDAGCSDGLACTLGDSCDGDGGCLARSFKVCDTPPPDPCLSAVGACDEATDGGCVYAVVPGQVCDDGNACTRDDTCLANGMCGAGPAVDCALALPPTECEQASGTCNPMTGCEFVPRTGACGDGGVCMGTMCVTPDAGPPGDAGAGDAGASPDSGAGDAGAGPDAGNPSDAGMAADAGAPDAAVVLAPTNFLPSQLPTQGVPAHYDLNCSGTITLNTALFNAPTFAPDGLCLAPALPPVTRVVQGAGLPELVIFTMDRFTLRPGLTLRFAPGTGGAADRVPVFAVRGDATISAGATISLTALPGPGRTGIQANAVGGGGPFCPTVAAGVTLNNRSGGGAGGSFGRPGGAGGRGNVSGTSPGGAGATPGPATGSAELSPLRGGCRGSAGGDSRPEGGGYAAGAFQLWARGTLTVNGTVVAAGGPGRADFEVGGGGGGGGSGGAILLEGTNVIIGPTARLAANGGSGAEGNGSSNRGRDGAYGSTDVSAVPGGLGGAQCGGNGGSSGARSADAGVGEAAGLDPTCMVAGVGGGGGGGGAVGRVRLNALTGCTIQAGAIISPPATSMLPSCAP